jgi:hypothetical protein
MMCRYRGLLPAALLAALLTGCELGQVAATTWQTSNTELERAARAGYPARIVFAPTATEAEAERWSHDTARRFALIVIGETDVFVLPAPGSLVLATPTERQAFAQRWVLPYVGQLDLDGAVRTAARGYCRELEERGLLPRLPPSTPIGMPNRYAYRFPSRNFDWGLCLTLAVALLAAVLSLLLRRRGGQSAPPALVDQGLPSDS